jgi:hypothetical protein
MAKSMPRRSLIDGGVTPVAMSVTVPIRNVALEQEVAGWGDLANRASEFSNMFLQIEAKRAEQKGLIAGAVQAPTYEEVELAANLGKAVDLPGDRESFNIYEQKVYEASLAVTESHYATLATVKMYEAFAEAEGLGVTPEEMKDRLDVVVNSYTEIFSSVSPTSGAKLHLNLIRERNQKFVSYNKSWHADNKTKRQTDSIVFAGEAIENMPEVFSGHIHGTHISLSNSLNFERQKLLDKLVIDFGSDPNGEKIIDTQMDAFDAKRKEVEIEWLAENTVHGDFGLHYHSYLTPQEIAKSLRGGTDGKLETGDGFGDDVWVEGYEAPAWNMDADNQYPSDLANTMQHLYNRLDSEGRDAFAGLVASKVEDKRKEQNDAAAQADADEVALHQGDADAIYALLDVPRNELNASVFEQADKLLKESTMPQTKGPGVNAHLNKTAIRDHIAKLKKEVRDSQTGDDTGATAEEIISYNTAWKKAADPTVSKTEFAAYMHENRDALPLSGNGGYNWTDLRNTKTVFRDEAWLDFDKALADGRKVISAGLRPTPAEKMAAIGKQAAAERLMLKEQLADDLEARYGNELRGIRDDGGDWKEQSDPFKPDNLFDKYVKLKQQYAKPLFNLEFDENGMPRERLYGPEAAAAEAAAVKAEEEAAAAEAEVARQEQEAAAEVVRLKEEAAEEKRQAKLREASIDDLRVLAETLLPDKPDIFHKAVLALIKEKGIKLDPDIVEGNDQGALKTWVINVLRELD